MIVVSDDGEYSIVVTSAANQKLTPRDLETRMQMIREAGLVLTQQETPVKTVECLAHLRPRECAADPRSCPGERASSRRLQSTGLGHSEPGGSSILYQRSSRERRNAETIPAIAVSVLDTTAAGDAFNGGFATALMLGKTPTESASFAAVVAGLSVTCSGAQSSMPSLAEVNACRNNQLRYV